MILSIEILSGNSTHTGTTIMGLALSAVVLICFLFSLLFFVSLVVLGNCRVVHASDRLDNVPLGIRRQLVRFRFDVL